MVKTRNILRPLLMSVRFYSFGSFLDNSQTNRADFLKYPKSEKQNITGTKVRRIFFS